MFILVLRHNLLPLSFNRTSATYVKGVVTAFVNCIVYIISVNRSPAGIVAEHKLYIDMNTSLLSSYVRLSLVSISV